MVGSGVSGMPFTKSSTSRLFQLSSSWLGEVDAVTEVRVLSVSSMVFGSAMVSVMLRFLSVERGCDR